MSGENNQNYYKFGADHPSSKPVIELVSGHVFVGQMDTSRELGVKDETVSWTTSSNAQKIRDGKTVTAPNRRTNCFGKSNVNYGNCRPSLETLQEELDKGNFVEVQRKIKN